MGLHLSVCTPVDAPPSASISYSLFGIFRRRLCESAGLGDIDQYVGFGGERKWPEEERLVPLLNHSDCEGQLWGWEVEGLADRLRSIIRLWPEDDPYRKYGESVADLFDVARREDGVVIFS